MKISPVPGLGSVVGSVEAGAPAPQGLAQKIRSLRMNTNATPGRPEDIAPPPAAEELTIPPTNEVVDEATQPLSPQFAALARQRRALQVKEREINDKLKALEAQSSAPTDAVPIARLKSDPIGTLLEQGVTYEQLTEAVLANQNGYNPEIAALKEKIAALESGFDKKLTDREAQGEQAALAEMRREASQLIAQGEDYELVRETGSLHDVMDLIERTYRQSGEVLDVREALKLVEDELVKDAMKIAQTKKVQSQFAPAPVPQAPQYQRQMRTLTNRDNASVPLSRKARALAAFAGTLKQ